MSDIGKTTILRRIPVRVWIWTLLFLTRYASQTIKINYRYSKYFMVNSFKTKSRKPWCMVDKTARSFNESWGEDSLIKTLVEEVDYGPRYDWTSYQLQTIALVFQVGFLISCLTVGLVIKWVGPYTTLLGCIMGEAIMNVFRVIMAHFHWKAFAALEFFMGFFVAMCLPALFVWMTRWAPFDERGIFVCSLLGSEFAELIMSLKMKYFVPLIGWRSIYYFNSSQAALVCILHRWFGSSIPETHPFISENELKYIKESQMQQVSNKRETPPYARILKSAAFWTLAMLNFGFAFGRMLHFAVVPEYLYEYVGSPYTASPYMEFLPYIGFKIVAIAASVGADTIRRHGWMKDNKIVKWYLVFSHFLPGCVLPFTSLAGCNLISIFALVSITFCLLGFSYISAHRATIDLSPNFVGAISGLMQAPVTVSAMAAEKLNHKFWSQDRQPHFFTVIFSLGSFFLLLPSAIFMKFGKVGCQPWNKTIEENKNVQPEKEKEATSSPRVRKPRSRPKKELPRVKSTTSVSMHFTLSEPSTNIQHRTVVPIRGTSDESLTSNLSEWSMAPR